MEWGRVAGLACRMELRERPSVVILLHGFGANAQDLAGLVPLLDPDEKFDWLLPQGTMALPGLVDAYAWFPLDPWLVDMGREADEEQLAESRRRLGFLFEFCRQRYEGIVLGGFSQGALLSLDFLLGGSECVPRGLCVFSGSLIRRQLWAGGVAGHPGCPVYQSHGRGDEVLPFALAESLGGLLDSGKFVVEKHFFDGGHEIPYEVVAGAREFLQRVLN